MWYIKHAIEFWKCKSSKDLNYDMNTYELQYYVMFIIWLEIYWNVGINKNLYGWIYLVVWTLINVWYVDGNYGKSWKYGNFQVWNLNWKNENS